MKGINIQFDNLVSLIQKNTANKDLLKSRDSFDLVYEKVTQQALKTVSMIFDTVLEDFSIKSSFTKLTKQLKSFLTLKPLTQQQQQDDYFDREFDQVKQFMNNRNTVISEVDTSQRGDIVKFLFQAENKQKDIEQFMGNMNKFSAIKDAGKRFRSVKKITVATENAEVQTLLEMETFERLEKKMPGLFRVVEGGRRTTIWLDGQGQNVDGLLQGNNSQSDNMFDIDAQIQQLIRQKIKQQQAAKQAQAAQQAALKKQQKQKQKQKTKTQAQQAKKKKPPQQTQLNKRQSTEVSNPKRSSVPGSSQFKTKGNLTSINSNSKKLTNVLTEEGKNGSSGLNSTSALRSSQGTNDYSNGDKSNPNSNTKQANPLQSLQTNMPSFQQLFQSLSSHQSLQGITPQQLKIIYQTFKTSTTQTLLRSSLFSKPQVDSRQCNTSLTFGLGGFVDETGEVVDWERYWEKECEGKEGKGNNNRKWNNKSLGKQKRKGYNGEDQVNQQNDDDQEQDDQTDPSSKERRQRKKAINGDNSSSTSNLHIQHNHTNKSRSTSNNQQPSSQPAIKSTLPTISHHTDGQPPSNPLAKQGKQAQQQLKNLRDTKYLKPMYNSKSANKQNYTLDMYKSRKDVRNNNNRESEHVNLPSLGRNANITKNTTSSIHQNLLDTTKSPYQLKKGIKNTLKHSSSSSSDQLFLPDPSSQNNKRSPKPTTHIMSKQQQRIMKQLQRIAKQGMGKNHLRHIAMYIQFIQSVHVRKCGEKCCHLERFYQFLHRNNLPNRRELLLHKADMNVSVEL